MLGQERSRLFSTSTANEPAISSVRLVLATNDFTFVRKDSTAAERAFSAFWKYRGKGRGGRRSEKRRGRFRRSSSSLISRFRRRTTTSLIRSFSSGRNSLVRVKRTGSSSSKRPENERVCPLCGVAVRNSLCSK